MNRTQENLKISETAANWWCDVLNKPKFDNGDKSLGGHMSSALASLCVKEIKKEDLEAFKKDLQDTIYKRLDELGDDRSRFFLDVDYGPCGTLYELAKKHNISECNFPWKTTMEFSRNHVSVNYGYGSLRKPLYANKVFYEDRIKSCEESIKYYNEQDDDFFTIATREECLNEIKEEKANYEKELKELCG